MTIDVDATLAAELSAALAPDRVRTGGIELGLYGRDASVLSGTAAVACFPLDTDEVAAALHNDLQEAAVSLHPILAEVVEAGKELGARGGIVSGSGPTVAFLVDSQAKAIDLSVGLATNGPAGEILRAVGPVPGTQLVHRPGQG